MLDELAASGSRCKIFAMFTTCSMASLVLRQGWSVAELMVFVGFSSRSDIS